MMLNFPLSLDEETLSSLRLRLEIISLPSSPSLGSQFFTDGRHILVKNTINKVFLINTTLYEYSLILVYLWKILNVFYCRDI